MAKKRTSKIRVARWTVQALFVALVAYLGWAHQYSNGDPLDTYCPFGAVASLWTTITTGGQFIPIITVSNFILFGALIVVTLIAGGIFCGWICPFGTIQDWIYALRKKVWKKRLVLPAKVDKYLGYLKYVLLIYIMYMSASTLTLWFYEFDPYRSFFHFGIETEFFFVAVGFTIIASLLIERFWCRYLCPMGAIVAPLSKLGLMKVSKTSSCTSCNLCMNNCNMGLKDIGDLGCNNCLECVTDCPTASKAIEVKFGSKKTSYSHAMVPAVGIILSVLLIIGSMGVGAWTTEAAFANVALPEGSAEFYDYPPVEKVVFCTGYFDEFSQVYDLTPEQIYAKLGLDPNTEPHQTVKSVSTQTGLSEGEIKDAVADLVIERGTRRSAN